MTARLTFYGGAGEVTGSNFLLDAGSFKVLVECGLFQGKMTGENKNYEPFPYDPKEIYALFVTHAHLDHTGRIPKLVKDGFRNSIYSTAPTRDLAELVLRDGVGILEEEAKKTRREPLYTNADIDAALALWKTIEYHEEVSLPDGVSVEMKNTGHILGSGMFEFTRGENVIVFTGDIGNTPDPILPNHEPLLRAKYLVMESVYGDKPHEDREIRRERIEDIVEDTVKEKGVLLIPAFSIERAQEMLFEIKTMIEARRIPPVPVFLDSPLAIDATELYRKYRNFLKKDVSDGAGLGRSIFSFPNLHKTRDSEESKRIADAPDPKIIIAGSGMSSGGRILFHEKKYLSLPTTTLLLVGYQAPGSLGRMLEERVKEVVILGEKIKVQARIEKVTGYSSHADSDALFSFVVEMADTAEKVFVVNSEPKTAAFFSQRLQDYLGITAVAPQEGESVELEF
ncbi:MAG: MBL fold metallo-hydrolase [Parcubacteria group bacterium]|nr:MBL fold metallo-hydrolase [Parcubacteria group bacterium]MBI2048946.1 MBL fold metallo-hydrolase [Parcubacteria group bacterium]